MSRIAFEKTARFSAALVIVAFFAGPISAATKVFVLAGQSNMAGVGGYTGYNVGDSVWGAPPGDVADDPCPSIYANQPGVKFWNYEPDALTHVYAPHPADFPDLYVHNPGVGNSWANLQNGYGYMTCEFGPELSFGAALHTMYPNDEICIVKYGISSTSLGYGWNASGSGGPQLNAFKARIHAALANLVGAGKSPQIAGMLWMQGEDDSTNTTYSNAYAANLKNLVTNMRTTFNAYGGADMKFVAGRITWMTYNAGWATWSNINAVRNAQWNVANPSNPYRIENASCFNTDDLEWAYYGHYGTRGQIDLGNRFAAAFAPVPEPSTVLLVYQGLLCVVGYLWRRHR
jgi:hypothetical protein